MKIASGIILMLCISGGICSSSIEMEGDSGPEEYDLGIGQEFNADLDAEYYPTPIKNINGPSMSLREIDMLVAERGKEYTDMDTWQEKENLASSFQAPSTSYYIHPHVECNYVPSSLQPNYFNQISINSNQTRGIKRPQKSVEEKEVKNKKRKKEERKKENTATSADTSDEWKEPSEKLDGKKKRIEYNLSIWNNARLNERHRKGMKYGYIRVYDSKNIINRGYWTVGDEDHIRLIQKHARHCTAVFRTTPTKNRMQFIISSRTTIMQTKLADWRAIYMHPELFQWVKECDDYYPGMPEDMIETMKEHGPAWADKEKFELEQKELEEWKETRGDTYARKFIVLPHAIDKKPITVVVESLRSLVATAVQMVMLLPEVWRDLFCLPEDFIEDMLKEETDSEHATIIRALCAITKKHTTDIDHSEIDKEYQTLLHHFALLLARTDLSPVQKVIRVYSILYCSLVWFYERASMFREKLDTEKKKNKKVEYTQIEGKHIIRNQVYLKWMAKIEMEKELSENTHESKEEINRWIIHPDVQKHYHVHYVDNTTQQYRRLCMPIGPDGRGIHTIDQIVKYIERVHGIRKENCVHPYTRDKNTGCWSYLKEKDRNRTVQDFPAHDIVFYYIKEGLKSNYFTFSEFKSFKKPSEETVRILLFISPLMRSIGESGPFEKKDGTEHTLVEDMQFKNRRPDVYAYKNRYREHDYKPVHHYYSNLYIRVANADIRTVDCYIMDMQIVREDDSAVVTWYVKVPQSIDEYTHCALSDEFWARPEEYDSFIQAVYCREYKPDTILYGFAIQKNAETDSSESNFSDIPDRTKQVVIDALSTKDRNHKLDPIESKLSDLDIELKEIKKREKEKGLSKEEEKELRRRRMCISNQKYRQRKKKKPIQEKAVREQKPIPSSFLSNRHSFFVIQYSNTETKSNLGLWNELFDMFLHKYNGVPSQ